MTAAPRTQPFARRLPYWVTRTIDTPLATLPVMILKDGTMTAGLRLTGVDVYCSDNAVLNGLVTALRGALNLLPPPAYVQAIFETGFDFEDLLRKYEALGGPTAHKLMREARARRAAMLRADSSLSRSQITYYLGHRAALGALAPHAAAGGAGRCLHPSRITAELVLHAAEQLAYSVSQFRDALSAAGLRSSLLSEGELLADIHRALNPVSSRLVPPPAIVDTADDLARLARGQRTIFRGPNLSSQLPLGCATFEADHIRLDDPPLLHRVLGLKSYPFATDPSWLFPIQYAHQPVTPMRVSVTHLATDAQLKKEELGRKRNVLQAQMARKTVDHDALAAYEEYEQLLATLATSDARVFETSIVATVTGKDLHELDLAGRAVKNGFAEAQSVATTLEHQQLLPWLSTLPGNGHRGPRPYPVLSANSAHLLPYFQPAVARDYPDFCFGTRLRALRPLTWRQSGARDNTNTFIIGSTGSGKTFFLSHLLKTTLSLGGHVVVADTKGPTNSTYRPMCELLGGQYIALDAADDSISFNPCPEQSVARRADGSFTDALDYLRDIICMMTVPDFDTSSKKDLHKRIATEVLQATYDATRTLSRPPILSDVVKALEDYRSTTSGFKMLASEMGMRLNLWCEDRRRGSLLNRPTRLSAENPFQVFDFFGLASDPDLAAVLISTLSARIFDKMQRLPLSTPKVFAFDEAWAFFDHSDTAAGLISALFRVARSYGASCFVASQSYKDVSESRAATAMMANASVYLLLRHNSQHEDVAATFALTPRQLELFRHLQFEPGRYAEQLYIDRHESTAAVLRYSPTPWELWIDTSRAIDMELRQVVFDRMRDAFAALTYLADRYPNGATAEALLDEKRRSKGPRSSQVA
jgi:hypothetical protein